jgi:hypothetical protein
MMARDHERSGRSKDSAALMPISLSQLFEHEILCADER